MIKSIAGFVIFASGVLYFFVVPWCNAASLALNRFSMRDLNNQQVYAESFKGKPVVLTLWGSWCGECIAEIPKLEAMQKKFEGCVHFIMLSDEQDSKIQNFMSRRPFQITSLRSQQRFKALGVYAVPATYIYDHKGGFVSLQKGRLDDDIAFEKKLNELLINKH